jgi:hypothetical protein
MLLPPKAKLLPLKPKAKLLPLKAKATLLPLKAKLLPLKAKAKLLPLKPKAKLLPLKPKAKLLPLKAKATLLPLKAKLLPLKAKAKLLPLKLHQLKRLSNQSREFVSTGAPHRTAPDRSGTSIQNGIEAPRASVPFSIVPPIFGDQARSRKQQRVSTSLKLDRLLCPIQPD